MQPTGQLHVLLGDVVSVDSRSLQHSGDALEARLAEKGAKPLAADLTLADRRVAVTVGAAGVAGVVDVEELELLQADLGVDLVDQVPHPLRGAHVVPGGMKVAGIDAEAEALRAASPVDQLAGLVEVEAEELGRAGCVLVD